MKKSIPFVVLALGLVGLLISWALYTPQPETISLLPTPPMSAPPSASCGVESCNGLDITCGSNVPEMCTMIYTAGDLCRQFASCEVVAGSCQQRQNPQFDQCKSCVESCEAQFGEDDPDQFFACESQCAG